MKSLLRHNAHEWKHTVCTDQLALSQNGHKKEVLKNSDCDSLTHNSQH